jgi:hypothetical protein
VLFSAIGQASQELYFRVGWLVASDSLDGLHGLLKSVSFFFYEPDGGEC